MNDVDFDIRRMRVLGEGQYESGPIIYWMSRDQRVRDNWALLYAQKLAQNHNVPLAVAFCLVPEFLEATIRQYGFMIEGLKQVERDLDKLDIPFFLVTGSPEKELVELLRSKRAGALVTDFSPLRINRQWKDKVTERIEIPFYEVDAHNIIPCWLASEKREYAAYTFRPKVNKALPEYLTDFPQVQKQQVPWKGNTRSINWNTVVKSLRVDTSVEQVAWLEPGESAAQRVLDEFLTKRLEGYNDNRNDPTRQWQSNLSPYIHFGQISAQRIALEAQRFDHDLKSQEAFLEQAIVRRELSDNFCFYDQDYDSVKSFPDWATATLEDHLSDPREHLYDRDQFEAAETHDNLWNAAQKEMIITGKMHGYMRMYWAKKILEWSPNHDEALRTAIYLNDRYELDGRDPNGYTGIAWSIGGVHDRPWFEREIFGKIRYMSYNGCKRKFDVDSYIKWVGNLLEEANQ